LRKIKARVIATSKKIPGFFKFSGYKQFNMMCPDVIMTKAQLRRLINETVPHFPFIEKRFKEKV
jgi:hypothetical protein